MTQAITDSKQASAALAELFWQSLHKLEDIRRQRLEDTESAEFHEEVDHLVFLWQLGNPVGITVGEERIFVPRRIVETITDVLRQTVVAQEKLQFRVAVAVVNEVRALPSQHLLSTFCQHTLKAHAGHEFSDFVRVDEARVAEDFRFLPE